MPSEEVWRGFFDPVAALKKLGLTSACNNVVDFGCGYGTFTLPAARVVSGIVYAPGHRPGDGRTDPRRAEDACLTNVEVCQRDFVIEGSGLPDGGASYAMLFNILHAEERAVLLREAWRVLEEEGKLAVMHWNYDAATPRGPSMDIRPKPEECRAWPEQAGFELLPPGLIDLPPYHYGLVFRRPAATGPVRPPVL